MSSIIPLTRRRGRPKVEKPDTDRGTPELQTKRAARETVEALDLCLEKGLISQEQHWCGIHLRWLYTLRYGAPGVRAIDLNEVSGLLICSDDPEWRAAREAEYHEALSKIRSRADAKLLIDICVHNERPDFLCTSHRKMVETINNLERIRDGLDILVRHWKREAKAANTN